MPGILIVAEIVSGKIREASFELASVAERVAAGSGRAVKSLVAGKGIGPLAEEFAKKGGGEVYAADHELLAANNVEAQAAAIRSAVAASGADLVLISNAPSGWDVAPRVAAALDAAFVSDCFRIDSEGGQLAFHRRVFNGKLDATLSAAAGPIVVTVQPGASAAFAGSTEGKVQVGCSSWSTTGAIHCEA
jgi:electron transfer flavoprotein alpha subunit